MDERVLIISLLLIAMPAAMIAIIDSANDRSGFALHLKKWCYGLLTTGIITLIILYYLIAAGG